MKGHYRILRACPASQFRKRPYRLRIIRRLQFRVQLVCNVHRTRICRETTAAAGSCWAVLKKALASWTSIKDLQFVSSSPELRAPDFRKPFWSTPLEVSQEEIA